MAGDRVSGSAEHTAQFDMDPGLGLSEVLGAIRRKLWILVVTVMASLLITYGLLKQITPEYTADGLRPFLSRRRVRMSDPSNP